jgi:glycine dehydrogenase subunit 1
MNFGGPFLGLFSTRLDLVRRIPGRIVGLTKDVEGKTGFVLTLQTREQHIRREKATSNICTNSGLLALAATIYMAALGKYGIQEVANLCLHKAHYLAAGIHQIDGLEVLNQQHFFKEFIVKFPFKSGKILKKLQEQGIFAGIDLSPTGYSDHLLVAVTEKRTKKELDNYISELKKVV